MISRKTRSVRRRSACEEHRLCDKAPGSKGRESVLGKVRKSLTHYARNVLKATKPHKPSCPLTLFIPTAIKGLKASESQADPETQILE